MLKKALILILVFVCLIATSQEKDRRLLTGFYKRYPWEGQFGIKSNINYYNKLGLELGVLVSDIPKRKDKDYLTYFGSEGWCVANQNLFLTSEMNSNHGLSLKGGYEFNYIFFGIRTSYLHYFDLKEKKGGGFFLPEAGFSLFGFINVFYGYAIPLHTQINNDGNHRISIGINWVYFTH